MAKAPTTGQWTSIDRHRPISTRAEGPSHSTSWSEMVSYPHIARLTRRTVAPAKVSACQSDENDCTRSKASLISTSMLRAANGFQLRKAALRMANSTT